MERCRGTAGRPRCPDKETAALAAALTLLAEQGFSRMPLDQVARAAGVGGAAIHLRYKAKTQPAAAPEDPAPGGCGVPWDVALGTQPRNPGDGALFPPSPRPCGALGSIEVPHGRFQCTIAGTGARPRVPHPRAAWRPGDRR
ncbi:TetR family transcriptional regulator [Streptomyces sp. NPDC055103]